MTDFLLNREDLIPDTRLQEGDHDAFRHLAIAARVAELAVQAETPVNVALFGSWGSGKSSFYELLRAELKRLDGTVRLVPYDAWKYGGSALKRNFISSAATELGFGDDDKNRKYHRGLYENKKTVVFDPAELFRDGRWRPYFLVALLAVTGALFATTLLAAFTSLVGDRAWVSEVRRLAPTVGTSVGGVLFAVASAMKVLDGAKVEVGEAVPSEDEQFAGLFKDLVAQATARRLLGTSTRRLVFFIDELDRCAKEDVVATLTSLRTFLDQPDCVFIVAADREVLEEALDKIDQATPVRQEEPYYSSASAFLDKIFQHQFALPPLHVGRLTGFARDLVAERGGLWGALRERDLLDDVLYTLIPSHVRAPRRVKVLLNNFATNVRVGEARGIDWMARSAEVAKLTVLQTEFPRLARDLQIEPRLPSLLLHPPPNPTERQASLLARHRLTIADLIDDDDDEEAEERAADKAARPASTYEPPDRLLTRRTATLIERQRNELYRYLESRSAAPDPARDLLFLEPAGEWAGLPDPELNQLIEDEAPTRPARVVDALRSRSAGERLAAARVIGHLSEREFGRERTNMITALADILDTLDVDEIAVDVGDLVANVRSYRSATALAPDHLPGILKLAIAAGSNGTDLASSVLRDSSLLDEPTRVGRVAQLLPRLTDEDAEHVEAAVVNIFPSEPAILLDVLASQPASTVRRLIRRNSEGLLDHLVTVAPPSRPRQQAAAAAGVERGSEATSGEIPDNTESILGALDERGAELLDEQALLIAALLSRRSMSDDSPTYAACRRRTRSIADGVDHPGLRNAVGLRGVRSGPPADWSLWASLLVPESPPRSDRLAEAALRSIAEAMEDAPLEVVQAAPGVIDAIASTATLDAKHADLTAVVPALEAVLTGNEWWESDAAAQTQRALHEVAVALARHIPDVATQTGELIEAVVREADPEDVEWDFDTARRFVALVEQAPAETLQMAQSIVAPDTVADAPTVLARLRLAYHLDARSLQRPAVEVDDIADALPGGSENEVLLRAWLALRPRADELAAMCIKLTGFPKAMQEDVEARLSALDADDNGQALLAVLASGVDERWISVFAAHAAPSVVLPSLAEQMRGSRRKEERDRVLAALMPLRFATFPDRRAAAGMALELLTDHPNQSKSDAAARIMEAVGDEPYGLKLQLREAVTAADASGNLGDRARKRFERLQIIRKKRRKVLGITLPS